MSNAPDEASPGHDRCRTRTALRNEDGDLLREVSRLYEAFGDRIAAADACIKLPSCSPAANETTSVAKINSLAVAQPDSLVLPESDLALS